MGCVSVTELCSIDSHFSTTVISTETPAVLHSPIRIPLYKRREEVIREEVIREEKRLYEKRL